MKAIKEKYQPIEATFRRELEAYIQKQKYLGLQYFTDVREYISTTAIMKAIVARPDGEYLLLTTGEEVRLDRLVRVDGQPAPGYDNSYFACDC